MPTDWATHDAQLLQLYAEHGRNWTKIQTYMPFTSVSSIKTSELLIIPNTATISAARQPEAFN